MKDPAVARFSLGLAMALCLAATSGAQAPDRVGEISLDSLLNTRISTASKYLQTSAEAAASVTIVSGEEIRLLGYSDLKEVLESIPGMYVSNDRNYPYLGTRGFGRPSDYNNRILLLIDGHTTNEQVWGGASVGSDMPVNLDAVERIEVVRGPGSALYGTSAMFAVINIVTRNGTQLSGGTLNARIGSGNDRQLSGVFGSKLGRHSSLSISALGNQSDGPAVFYPEFANDPITKGAVRDLDWEKRGSILATLITGNVTTRAGIRGRSKGIPTASYATTFGDPREMMFDGAKWAEVAYRTSASTKYQLSARIYGDRANYDGTFPYGPTVTTADRGLSTSIGAEAAVTWDVTSRNRLTLGTEHRRMTTAMYQDSTDGVVQRSNAPYSIASFFAQNELEVFRRLKLVGGLRFDQKVGRWKALLPRIAAVLTPDDKSTIKLLYGEAYRAPSVAESDLETDIYNQNFALKPERIKTYELALERRIASTLLVGVSGYNYSIRNLIEQTASDTATGITFGNLMAVRGRGLEFTGNLQPANGPISIRAWYNLQRTLDRASGLELSNSPNHAANFALIARGRYGLHGALSFRHESGRILANRESTSEWNRADLNIGITSSRDGGSLLLRNLDVSLRTSNLLNDRYSVPGGLEHIQHAIEQNGRMFSLRVRRTF